MERYSVRLHGRGGQGLKSMIQEMIAPLLLQSGFNVQAFPFFGGERRGFLVSGYLRFGLKKITTHSFIEHPDMAIVFDQGMIESAVKGLIDGGILLINTAAPKQFMGLIPRWRVYSVDARSIAIKHGIGQPEDPYLAVNTAMAGAVIKMLESVSQKFSSDELIYTVLNEALPQKIQANFEALKEGKQSITMLLPDGSPMWQYFLGTGKNLRINQPNELCTKCRLCYLFCPKRAIEVASDETHIIHEEKCNYCGICIEICPRDAIKITLPNGGTP